MKISRITGPLILLLTAVIWGFAFVAQKNGMESLGPSAFNAIRSLIGAAVLIPVIVFMDLLQGRRPGVFGAASGNPAAVRNLLTGGGICGVVLTAASLLQQYGISSESTGKSGFLTALYIVIVPVAGMFLKRNVSWLRWIAVGTALTGTYLLCIGPGERLRLSAGDLWLIGCAAAFSVHILTIDHFAPLADCVRMACIQFFLTGVLSLIVALATGESLAWSGIRAAMIALLFCGVGSSGIAYTLQMAGQKYVHPVAASLIMSLESVFAMLGGLIFLHEDHSIREYAGCAVIFAAVILAQIPVGSPRK